MPQYHRKPYVAGYFYPGDPNELWKLLENLFRSRRGPGSFILDRWSGKSILGAILPHAGYIYSGEIAAHGYAAYNSSNLKDIVILIGPNHHGLGASISIYPGGKWETPLGVVEIEGDMAEDLGSVDGYIALDELGHIYEHSLEVHIPFLQFIYKRNNKSFKILPITMLLQSINAVEELGEALVNLIKQYNHDNIFIIASSDFTHYESAGSAASKDKHAFEAIERLDYKLLIDNVYKYGISMCGYGPAATLLYVAKKLGGYRSELLKYGNSGEVTGDYDSVVAYASFIIYKK